MTRVLWLSNETPDQQGQGGQRRQFFQIRECARAGHEVTVCCLAGDQDDAALRQHAEVIRTRTHWRGRVPLGGHRRLLRRLAAQEWGAVILTHTESWPTFGELVETVQESLWVDLHNVLGRDVDGRWTKWNPVEREICTRATMVSVCSTAELARLMEQQHVHHATVTVMPHGIDPLEWRHERNPAGRPVIKLFGNWGWDPNRRGLDWFLSRVWANLRVPNAKCEIAGSGARIPPGLESSTSFVGRVASVDAWASDAWAVVVPVIGGIGAPVKYLEALATRAPVLSTPDGAPMAREAATLVSADPDEWTSVLGRLLSRATAPDDSSVRMDQFNWTASTAPLLSWLTDQ